MKKDDNNFIFENNISYEEMHYPIKTNKRKLCKSYLDTKDYKIKKIPMLLYLQCMQILFMYWLIFKISWKNLKEWITKNIFLWNILFHESLINFNLKK